MIFWGVKVSIFSKLNGQNCQKLVAAEKKLLSLKS